MLSIDQADKIADVIVGQARNRRPDAWSVASPSVPLIYRSRELSSLPTWVQAVVVQEAQRTATSTPLFILATLALLLGLVGAFAYVLTSKPALATSVVLAAVSLPVALKLVVRREAQVIALHVRHATTPEDFLPLEEN